MRAVFLISLLLFITTAYSQSVNQHYYKRKSQDNLNQKKLKQAEQYADSALMLAVNTNNYDSLADAYQSLLLVHEEKKDHQRSFDDFNMIIAYRDSAAQLKNRNVMSESKFQLDKEIKSHDQEASSLRDLIINLEEDRRNSQVSLYIIISATIVLFVVAGILLIRRRRHTVELLEQSEIESQRRQSFKQTISHLLDANLKDALYSFESLNKNLANEFSVMDKDGTIELLKRLQASAEDIILKLNNVFQWVNSQADTASFNPVNLEIKGFVKEIIARFDNRISERNITIDVFMPDGQIIFADRKMIETVLENLISNAIQNTPEGGTITFFAGRKDGLITLGVKDTGNGMSEEIIRTLFSKSETHEPDQNSKGVGLMLCKDLVEKNGGRMYVESKVGEGSNFYFSLPEGEL